MNAIELADELELKGVSTRVMRLVIAELRCLAAIEQKYLAIMALDPVAYRHDVVCGDGEPDTALSFNSDDFPLKNVYGFRSLGSKPLYTLPKD